MCVANRLPTIFRGTAHENWMDRRFASIGMDRGMRFYTCGTPCAATSRNCSWSDFGCSLGTPTLDKIIFCNVKHPRIRSLPTARFWIVRNGSVREVNEWKYERLGQWFVAVQTAVRPFPGASFVFRKLCSWWVGRFSSKRRLRSKLDLLHWAKGFGWFWSQFTLRGILSRWARKLNVAFTLASLPVAVGFRTWGTTVYCCPSKAAIYCGIFCLIFLKHFGFLFPSLPSWSAQWGQSPANYRKMLHLEHGHRAFWGKIRGS